MDKQPIGSIWPARSQEEQQIREVYSRFGLAMYVVQVLEHAMVNAVMVLRLLPTMTKYRDQAGWERAFDRFYDVELGKTYGNVLKGLEGLTGFPVGLLVALKAAKERRDYLAHKFFREHDLDIMSESGRKRMIAECEDLIDLFKSLDRQLEAFLAPQCERFGITNEWIDKHIAKMEEEARRRHTNCGSSRPDY